MKSFAIFCSIVLLFSCGAGNAPAEAKKFADKHFPANTGTECISGMGADSDDDGYVSCTIFTPGRAIPIECAVNHGSTGCGQTGCRMSTGKNGGKVRR